VALARVGASVLYAEPSPEWEVEVRDEGRVRLADVAREEGEAFVYEYDLGDSWRHQVLVEEVTVEAGEARGPRCLGGERACPPEDSGGVGGYRLAKRYSLDKGFLSAAELSSLRAALTPLARASGDEKLALALGKLAALGTRDETGLPAPISVSPFPWGWDPGPPELRDSVRSASESIARRNS
jgi:hypothetical protein